MFFFFQMDQKMYKLFLCLQQGTNCWGRDYLNYQLILFIMKTSLVSPYEGISFIVLRWAVVQTLSQNCCQNISSANSNQVTPVHNYASCD